MNAPHAHDCPAADRLVDDAIRAIGAEIDALAIPRLLGVVLGGGYARGEGGVILRASRASQVPSPKSQNPLPDGQPATCDLRPATPAEPALSNDLDFYVVAEDGASPADLAAIAAALRPVSEKWTARLGVDVDFSPPKTPWRIRHDEERLMIQELVHGYCDVAGRPGAELAAIAAALRPVSEKWTARLGVDVDFSPPKTPWRIAHDAERLMIQELLHGYCDVAGKPGAELFAGVARREPSALPAMEAIRLLVNRGAGLLLADESGASPDFVARNVNKAILGCGDARLIAEGRYRWRALDRADALADDLYRNAVQWKFRPRPEPPCDWETARERWLGTVDSVCASGGGGRTLRAAARWLVRRRSLGPAPLRTLGLDPLVRILRAMRPLVRDRKPFPASLRRDWEVFN